MNCILHSIITAIIYCPVGTVFCTWKGWIILGIKVERKWL